ncbi:trypsin-like peptidase domain-containing protein [Aristaeella lactis]|uniref:Trypsin-like peptidase domain-containing protein n=1 Tax=Aristaeella lactis TaxID=3046383 RepID=A0AC61PQ80_9FIRM|nr:trypsin-like peptidase domain-containing protein [Aristaeella lactis]QUA54288.1 trypsin-like peptidase domain-containing protein [Aristaeella lactis]SMC88418.1 Trypsin-like peptidase domain-containing protein [Aristaeella lactis]
MKRIVALIVVIVLSLICLSGQAGGETAYSFREDYEKIDLAAKSLFYVETYDSQHSIISSASGFVAFDEHLFVTNQHVIKDASYLKVWDDDNNMYMIDKVVMSDEAHDIAILLFPEGKQYNSLELNGDEILKRGQPVVTIGSPKGFQNTVAYGNIGAFPKMDDIEYIQFTAPISHGSSGGCLFDDIGKVIGVTSAGIEEGQNLNFAIPIKYVLEMYDQWDKNNYEQLGSARSWDMVGVTPPPPLVDTLPVDEFLNRYGIINRLVNFRNGPSTNSPKNGNPIAAGEYVYLIMNVMNDAGEVWSRINYNGKVGYVRSDCINLIDENDGKKYDNAQPTPAPIYSSTDKLPSGVTINLFGIINHLVNFRTGPSIDSALAGEPLPVGKRVFVLSNETNEQGEMWSRVSYNMIEGYIKSEYIYLINQGQ